MNVSADLLLSLLDGAGAGLEIGRRVRLRRNPKAKGTIRHAGAVHFGAGDYIGVELDSGNGQHDGTVDGIIYFTCKPKRGTFVTPLDVELLAADEQPAVSSLAPHALEFIGAHRGNRLRPPAAPPRHVLAGSSAAGRVSANPSTNAAAAATSDTFYKHDDKSDIDPTALFLRFSETAGGDSGRATTAGPAHFATKHEDDDAQLRRFEAMLEDHGVPNVFDRSRGREPASSEADDDAIPRQRGSGGQSTSRWRLPQEESGRKNAVALRDSSRATSPVPALQPMRSSPHGHPIGAHNAASRYGIGSSLPHGPSPVRQGSLERAHARGVQVVSGVSALTSMRGATSADGGRALVGDASVRIYGLPSGGAGFSTRPRAHGEAVRTAVRKSAFVQARSRLPTHQVIGASVSATAGPAPFYSKPASANFRRLPSHPVSRDPDTRGRRVAASSPHLVASNSNSSSFKHLRKKADEDLDAVLRREQDSALSFSQAQPIAANLSPLAAADQHSYYPAVNNLDGLDDVTVPYSLMPRHNERDLTAAQQHSMLSSLLPLQRSRTAMNRHRDADPKVLPERPDVDIGPTAPSDTESGARGRSLRATRGDSSAPDALSQQRQRASSAPRSGSVLASMGPGSLVRAPAAGKTRLRPVIAATGPSEAIDGRRRNFRAASVGPRGRAASVLPSGKSQDLASVGTNARGKEPAGFGMGRHGTSDFGGSNGASSPASQAASLRNRRMPPDTRSPGEDEQSIWDSDAPGADPRHRDGQPSFKSGMDIGAAAVAPSSRAVHTPAAGVVDAALVSGSGLPLVHPGMSSPYDDEAGNSGSRVLGSNEHPRHADEDVVLELIRSRVFRGSIAARNRKEKERADRERAEMQQRPRLLNSSVATAAAQVAMGTHTLSTPLSLLMAPFLAPQRTASGIAASLLESADRQISTTAKGTGDLDGLAGWSRPQASDNATLLATATVPLNRPAATVIPPPVTAPAVSDAVSPADVPDPVSPPPSASIQSVTAPHANAGAEPGGSSGAEPSSAAAGSVVPHQPPAIDPCAATHAGGKCVIRSYAGICERGFNASNPDKPNQDAIVMTEDPATDCVLLAVFDGHGEDGHLVAGHFRDHLPRLLFASTHLADMVPVPDNIPSPAMASVESAAGDAAARSNNPKSGIKPPVGPPRLRRNAAAAARAALAACERAVLSDPGIDCSLSGCTGCVAVIDGADVTVLNVGDSRAALMRRSAADGGEVAHLPAAASGGSGPTAASENAAATLAAHAITVDHKPTMASETRRILLKGGRVQAIRYDDGGEGPVRVWLRDDDVPGLAMSRSLGDAVGKRAGVTSEPDVYAYTLVAGADAFLVLASDGLWEFTSCADAARVMSHTAAAAARDNQERATLRAAGGDTAGGEEPPAHHLQLALDALASLAAARWEAKEGVVDDCSIVIAELGQLGPASSNGGPL